MLYLIGVIAIAFGIGLSIALHEIGHMLPAKLFGVRVPAYMIGFGPTIFSRKIGETEYGLKAIPLGGYVRMIGMFPPRPKDGGKLRASSTGRWQALAEQARNDSESELLPGDENRVFYRLPVWKKIVVMSGGPLMNLLLAAILLVVLVVGIGMPKQVDVRLGQIMPCASYATTTAPCPDGKVSAAAAAGLQRGDIVRSLDGKTFTDSTKIAAYIRSHGGKTMPIVVERAGKTLHLQITPTLTEVPKIDEQGLPVKNADGSGQKVQAGFLGTGLGGRMEMHSGNLGDALANLKEGVVLTAKIFVRIPEKMVGVWHAATSGQERDLTGPISVVGVGRIAGDVTDNSHIAVQEKISLLISLLASLNIALFVFNLVPLLPLDGGHVAGALWEGSKRTWARLRGRNAEGIYTDTTKALPLTYAAAFLLIGMSVLLIYADVVNPISFGR